MEFVVIWFVIGIISAIIAPSRGRSGCGWFILGVLFGPFALIVLLVVPKNQEALDEEKISSGGMKKCPACAELIKSEAVKCRYCGKDFAVEAEWEEIKGDGSEE